MTAAEACILSTCFPVRTVTRGHNMQSRWSKAAIFTTRWAAGWQNG
ncbi:RHS repeat protein, partial [Escherichia coli]